MKFSLKLDESLFDDDPDLLSNKITSDFLQFDDDFVDYENEHDVNNVPPGPAEGSDTGVASELISLINDEWEAIEGYNNTIATLRSLISENPFYADAIKVLEEINAEENAHVGQLQEILKRISPNAEKIEKGTEEAVSQLGFVGGVLPVQSWDNVTRQSPSNNSNNIEDTCTLSDVDDEM